MPCRKKTRVFQDNRLSLPGQIGRKIPSPTSWQRKRVGQGVRVAGPSRAMILARVGKSLNVEARVIAITREVFAPLVCTGW